MRKLHVVMDTYYPVDGPVLRSWRLVDGRLTIEEQMRTHRTRGRAIQRYLDLRIRAAIEAANA